MYFMLNKNVHVRTSSLISIKSNLLHLELYESELPQLNIFSHRSNNRFDNPYIGVS